MNIIICINRCNKIAQRLILLVLKKTKRWMTAAELTELCLDCSRIAINRALKMLIKTKEIEYKVNPKMKHGYFYRVKS